MRSISSSIVGEARVDCEGIGARLLDVLTMEDIALGIGEMVLRRDVWYVMVLFRVAA